MKISFYQLLLVFTGALLCVFGLSAITVYNKTEVQLFVAPYYVNNEATRAGDVMVIEPQKVISIERPKRKLFYNRELIFVDEQDILKDSLSLSLFKKMPSKNIGSTQGNSFYIVQEDEELIGYNLAEWKVVRPTVEILSRQIEQGKSLVQKAQDKLLVLRLLVQEKISEQLSAVQENPYKEQVGYVRTGNELCGQERDYLTKRMPIVKQTLETVTGTPVITIPTIALICSGGGYRAMLSTLGSLCALDGTGLLNAVTYISALSGSTWTVGPWLSMGLPITAFRTYLIETITANKGLASVGPQRAEWIAEAIATRFIFGQSISLVDFYGGLIANALLKYAGNKRQQIYLSNQAQQLNDATFPFPIYTAIRADQYAELDWYEMTPFEVGGAWLGIYVPTWAYGRSFNGGRSLDFAPEVSLGFNLGTYGSAFALTFNRLYEEFADDIPSTVLKIIIRELLKVVGNERISAAKVSNFTYGMPNSSIKDLKILAMSDAGLAFNLPYPPLSGERPERSADLLIFLDASATIAGAPELRSTELYARQHNLKFPSINYDGIDSRAITVFKDDNDPTVPVVIYMPLIKDKVLWQAYKDAVRKDDHYVKVLDSFDPVICNEKEFCSTFNFSYDQEQAEQLIMQTEFNMMQSRQQITDAFEWVIARKNFLSKPE